MSKGSESNRNMPNGARRNQVGNISEDRAKEILDSIGLDVNIKDYDSISLVEKDDAYDLYLNGENGIERREIGADSIPYDFEDYMDDNNAWTLNIEKKTKETDIKQIPIKKGLANKVLTASKDNTANQIINFLNKYKINYRGGSVDSNIENVTGKLAKYDEIEKDVPRGASVYRMSCWNGGQNGLRKDYASADIVSPNNNTDTKWYFVVNKGECSIISYERGNYGLSDKKNNIGKFKIK